MHTIEEKNIQIIGVDAGYGNIKTANTVFATGITAYDHEPMFGG
ncbi:MAG: plasmid segregation actin-type ATPase ParM, partial [Candidatus Ventricola sp.]